MSKPEEHFNTINGHLSKVEREINWIGFNGHLITLEQKEVVNDISVAVHKARKVFETLKE